jgi:radical SAM protein with 4Fe4S-binding SPASM domain
MTINEAVNILDLCRDYRGAELETMDILGGEPLLWRPLKKYIEELLRRGIKPWIFTNMIAIRPEMASWLFERQVHITGKLNFQAEHQRVELQAQMIGRSPSVAFRMWEAIGVFLAAGYRAPMFRLQNLVRITNIYDAHHYYRWCLERNIGTDLELMGSGEGVGSKYFEQAPNRYQIAKMVSSIQEVRAEFGLEPAEVLMPHVFGSCPFFDKGLYFAVDGTIRACSNSTATLANIADEDPICKAYESPLICNRLKLTRETVKGPCSTCHKWEKCRGGCRATVEGMGDPFGSYPLCPVPLL